MSTYSNVYATTLKNAANTALNELPNHNLINIRDSFNSNILSPKVNNLVKDKLNSISSSNTIHGSILVLKSKLQNLKSVAEHIEKIKTYDTYISNNKKDKDENGNLTETAKKNIAYYNSLISSEETTINNLLS